MHNAKVRMFAAQRKQSERERLKDGFVYGYLIIKEPATNHDTTRPKKNKSYSIAY